MVTAKQKMNKQKMKKQGNDMRTAMKKKAPQHSHPHVRESAVNMFKTDINSKPSLFVNAAT